METPGSKRANLLAQGHTMRKEQSQRTVQGHRDQPTLERDELRDPGRARRPVWASASPSAKWGDSASFRESLGRSHQLTCAKHADRHAGATGATTASCTNRPPVEDRWLGAPGGQEHDQGGRLRSVAYTSLFVLPPGKALGPSHCQGSPKGCPSSMTTLRPAWWGEESLTEAGRKARSQERGPGTRAEPQPAPHLT